MLCVFPITLTGAAKRWVDRLSPGTVNSWDLLKKAFIQRYCPPSKTAKQLEDICNFKQEGDETLYQAWERYNDLLNKCPTHDINSHQKGPIPGMTPTQALMAIQTMADHSQKWHDGSSRRNIDSSTEGIAAIVSKLDSLGRDMKKLKENVHAIQRDTARSSGERRPSLTEIINKYMEEAAKRHVEQDEWLNKFYQNTETNREAHDKIIQGLETKVRTLTNEVEGRTNYGKFEECKAIFTKDGSPLYTPFYYSPKEIKYFSANSGFSDNERQETKKSGMEEALATLNSKPEIKQVPQEEKQNVSYYVEPYEPPIPFPRRLEHHAEETLVHETMESLKKIKINRPLLKEIRQTDNYAKHMKDLVANKPRTKEDEEIRMNPRCSALLQNQLPHKEQDPVSFILPCSIGRLDFNNALADLGASINIMPLSMYKLLGMGKLEPINMVIEMADNTKCTHKGIVKKLLVKIDKFIFQVDFVILDMVEDFRMPIILGRPLLATTTLK
ncbi:reverse transcriptase domain-containing protein [Tanacetum coccineum]